MDKLSTELDANIAECLSGDAQALSALSRVSKYYKAVAEPFLYEEIAIADSRHSAIKSLLLTLLNRNGLALRIKSFSLTMGGRGPPPPLRTDLGEAFKGTFSHMQKIGDKIHEMVRPTTTPDIALVLDWVRQVLDPAPHADGALALVLCMANNLESLSLYGTYGRRPNTTLSVLQLPWQLGRGPNEDYPFRKLKHFHFNHVVWDREPTDIPTPLSLKSLHIEGTGYWRRGHTKLPLHFPLSEPFTPGLSTLVLEDDNDFAPDFMERTLASPWFRKLKQLILKTKEGYCGQLLNDYDPSRLVRAMETHVPELEVFEWTRHRLWPTSARGKGPKFDSFKGLNKLHTLRLASDLLIPDSDTLGVTISKNPYAVFPASLQYLELTNLCRVGPLVEGFYRHFNIGRADGEGFSVLDALKRLLATFPLKGLTLRVMKYDDFGTLLSDFSSKDELEPQTVFFLRYAADQLAKLGTRLDVYMMMGVDEDRLLIRPGYTAPRPHSIDWLHES
ncbi:hypothetical protein BU26DRAFT_514575 [Trematosphaeria pertusa]|uniref:F-box domain-containing protein n=1 Tax=Trematosphaeria pertusa TaxID=390896 RepID=A0A6A6IWD5_9PLEO|nr:uncharacterized protein BU26DRAFT_514575 [Trematosphaeria pertusa]KAF2254714.1 hypothetical protein BU26DRAFT_514575 [Trematosphaeria pertusa]